MLRDWPKKEALGYTAVCEKHSPPLDSASRLLGGARRRFMWSNKSKHMHDMWVFFFCYTPTFLICPLPLSQLHSCFSSHVIDLTNKKKKIIKSYLMALAGARLSGSVLQTLPFEETKQDSKEGTAHSLGSFTLFFFLFIVEFICKHK